MSENEFEKHLAECEKSKTLSSILEPLMGLDDKDRMYLMKRLDAMNKEPKEITIIEQYKSFMW